MENLQSVFTVANNRAKVEQQDLWLRSVIKQWLCGATELWITDGITRFPFHSSSNNRKWTQVTLLAAGSERRSAATPKSACPSRTFHLTPQERLHCVHSGPSYLSLLQIDSRTMLFMSFMHPSGTFTVAVGVRWKFSAPDHWHAAVALGMFTCQLALSGASMRVHAMCTTSLPISITLT